jgi:hypothetical protein
LLRVAVTGGNAASRRLRIATRSAVKMRPGGMKSSQALATSSVSKSRPARSSRTTASIVKLRSSSSGMPSMFSARLVGRLARFHG